MRKVIKKIPLIGQFIAYLRYQNHNRKIRLIDRHEGDRPVDMNGIAVPSARLRFRVHGDLSQKTFLNVGRKIARNIRESVESTGVDWSSFHDILDFGCGSARVMRYFLAENRGQNFTGVDINQELIDWCYDHIDGVDWRAVPTHPPSGLPDNSFDFIYGISVFTHLDEGLQSLWLEDLARIIRPDGVILLTVLGSTYADHIKLKAADRKKLQEKGFLYFSGVTGKWKLDGLPDFYQTAIQTVDQIQQKWCEHFKVVAYVPGGINKLQDIVLLKPR